MSRHHVPASSFSVFNPQYITNNSDLGLIILNKLLTSMATKKGSPSTLNLPQQNVITKRAINRQEYIVIRIMFNNL